MPASASGHCPQCGKPITAQTREQIIGRILALPAKTQVRGARARRSAARRASTATCSKTCASRASCGRASTAASCRSPTICRSTARCGTTSKWSIDRLTAGPSIRGRLAEAVDTALAVGEGQHHRRGAGRRRRAERAATAAQVPPTPAIEGDAATAEDEDAPARTTRGKRAPAARSPATSSSSSHFACTECGISFEEPTPQLFSFNSPQGMCLTCDGLGEFFSFDPERLVAATRKVVRRKGASSSSARGRIWAAGSGTSIAAWPRRWSASSSWPRARCSKRRGTSFRRSSATSGCGAPATSTSRSPGGPARRRRNTAARSKASSPSCWKNIAPARATVQIRQLEQYMSVIRCPDCAGQRLNPQACAVTLTTASPQFADRPHS